MMSEGNLYQKLMTLFSSGERKIVFWYDADGEFSETVDSLNLGPVRIHRLTGTNQFETKYLVEKKYPADSFLLYAPYKKPEAEDDFLLDTFLYSEEFCFDSIGILCGELNAPISARPIFSRFQKFFNSSDRTAKFKRYRYEHFSEREIALGIMGVLCGISGTTFVLSDILSKILFNEGGQDRLIDDFSKYGVTDPFWREAEQQFGYSSPKPDVFDLAVSLFLTSMVQRFDKKDIPKNWQPFILPHSNNASIFLKSIRDNSKSAESYRTLAARIADEAALKENLRDIATEAMIDNETFDEIDQILIQRMAERFLIPDGLFTSENIPELCDERGKTFFGERHDIAYKMLSSAYGVLRAAHYEFPVKIADLVSQYQKEGWKIDQAYRHFYTAFDKISDESERKLSRADKIREQVEQVYNNVYLETITANWTKALAELSDFHQTGLERQIHFYKNRIEGKIKERTVVIISDAFRYEVAQELVEKLNKEKKTTASINMMIGSLPSITELGMIALLPHQELGYSQEKFTIDGDTAETIDKREQILKKRNEQISAIQFADASDWDSNQLRAVFTQSKLYYVYHNQIDARGDKPASEKEVFRACEEAIAEIIKFITRLNNSASISHFIITADHGFLYRRDHITGSEKIAGNDKNSAGKRYGVTNETTDVPGLRTFPLGKQLESTNTENVIVPIGPHIFKHPGAGLNYVHGGASPQEILIPVVDVKVAHTQAKFTTASIDLIGTSRKITSLNVTLEFLQDSPVGGQVKSGLYDLVFVDENGNEISEHQTYEANSTEPESSQRIFKLAFVLKSIEYDPRKSYFLKVIDKESKMKKEKAQWPFTIDIIFSGDFGF